MLTASKSDTLSGLAAAIPAAVPADYLAIFLTREETLNLEEVLAERKSERLATKEPGEIPGIPGSTTFEEGEGLCGVCGLPGHDGGDPQCPGPEKFETEPERESIEVGQVWGYIGKEWHVEIRDHIDNNVNVLTLGPGYIRRFSYLKNEFLQYFVRLPFRREEA